MTKNRFLYKAMAGIVSAALMTSMTITAAAWNEDPGESETTTAVTTEATLPELGGNLWETTTTTEEPDAVLEDDEVASEDDEDISAEDIDPEITEPEVTEEEIIEEPEETEAPATTTAPATAAPAPSNTAAPDSYQAVEPFKMYVPEVLNVRGGPGTDYDKLGQVYANNVISIIGISGEWYVFDYYGADGYLLSSLLQEVPETPVETTTTAAPETDTTLPPVEDEGGDDAVIEDDDSFIEDDAAPVTTEAPAVPEETTTKETPAVAGPAAGDNGTGSTGGIPPVILALICAVAAFVLIGVVPVLVHRSHHKKLYQY